MEPIRTERVGFRETGAEFMTYPADCEVRQNGLTDWRRAMASPQESELGGSLGIVELCVRSIKGKDLSSLPGFD
jgi:hypothetical protein